MPLLTMLGPSFCYSAVRASNGDFLEIFTAILTPLSQYARAAVELRFAKNAQSV